ncbi:MAG: hypothetical protein L6V93_18470 [Clostridiales bacterium]|nr:MAG: hypothetical protein L6V93_18470 [Clostridiales bacterium]
MRTIFLEACNLGNYGVKVNYKVSVKKITAIMTDTFITTLKQARTTLLCCTTKI